MRPRADVAAAPGASGSCWASASWSCSAILAAVAGVGLRHLAVQPAAQGEAEPGQAASAGGPQNYLIVGSDSRSGHQQVRSRTTRCSRAAVDATGGQRSDTIMVLRIDPQQAHGQAAVVPPRPVDPDLRHRRQPTHQHRLQQRSSAADQHDRAGLRHPHQPLRRGQLRRASATWSTPSAGCRCTSTRRCATTTRASTSRRPAASCSTANRPSSFARSRELQYNDTDSGEWKSDGTGDLGRITRQQIFIRKVIDRAERRRPASTSSPPTTWCTA